MTIQGPRVTLPPRYWEIQHRERAHPHRDLPLVRRISAPLHHYGHLGRRVREMRGARAGALHRIRSYRGVESWA